MPKIVTIKKKCSICSKEFELTIPWFKITHGSNRKTCSTKCRNEAVSRAKKKQFAIRREHSFYPRIIKQGRSAPMFMLRVNKKSISLHRYLAQETIGRDLKPNEVVHHINGDSLDCRRRNLLLCDSNYHMYLHKEMSRKYATSIAV